MKTTILEYGWREYIIRFCYRSGNEYFGTLCVPESVFHKDDFSVELFRMLETLPILLDLDLDVLEFTFQYKSMENGVEVFFRGCE